MTDSRTHRFDVARPVTVDVRLPSGELAVTAGAEGNVTVDVRGPDAERFTVELLGERTVLVRPAERRTRWKGHRVVVEVPPGTRVEARLASADLHVATDLAGLAVETASGDVSTQAVGGDCEVNSASGDLRIGAVGGVLSLRTASGDATVEAANGPVRLHSASGDIRIVHATAAVSAKTASGDIAIDCYAGDDLEASTMAGDVRLGLPAGRNLDVALQTLAGDVRTDFDTGGDGPEGPSDGRVDVRSFAGDIVLGRARSSS